MRIIIKSNEGYKFNFWLPTGMLKAKFIYKTLKKYGNIDYEPFINILPKIHKSLKEYIKINGHFTLIDVVLVQY